MEMILFIIGVVLVLLGFVSVIFKIQIGRTRILGIRLDFFSGFLSDQALAYISGGLFILIGLILLVVGLVI